MNNLKERVQELETENEKLLKAVTAARKYENLIRSFFYNIYSTERIDSLDRFYVGARTIEQAGMELERIILDALDG